MRKEADGIINAYTDVIIEELKEERSFRIRAAGNAAICALAATERA